MRSAAAIAAFAASTSLPSVMPNDAAFASASLKGPMAASGGQLAAASAAASTRSPRARGLLGEALLFGQALFFRDPSFLGRLLGSDAGLFLCFSFGLGLGLGLRGEARGLRLARRLLLLRFLGGGGRLGLLLALGGRRGVGGGLLGRGLGRRRGRLALGLLCRLCSGLGAPTRRRAPRPAC